MLTKLTCTAYALSIIALVVPDKSKIIMIPAILITFINNNIVKKDMVIKKKIDLFLCVFYLAPLIIHLFI